MRRGQIVIGVALLFSALTMTGAPAAFAATPQDICADLADGHIDGTYTNAEWTAYFSDPTIQGYGCGGIATPVTPAPATPGTSAPAGGVVPVTVLAGVKGARHTVTPATAGVQGAQHTVKTPVTRSAAAPLGTAKATGTLPFTGAQLGLFALVGLALLATGLVLRSTGRPSQRR
jgi:hypothetical protein